MQLVAQNRSRRTIGLRFCLMGWDEYGGDGGQYPKKPSTRNGHTSPPNWTGSFDGPPLLMTVGFAGSLNCPFVSIWQIDLERPMSSRIKKHNSVRCTRFAHVLGIRDLLLDALPTVSCSCHCSNETQSRPPTFVHDVEFEELPNRERALEGYISR